MRGVDAPLEPATRSPGPARPGAESRTSGQCARTPERAAQRHPPGPSLKRNPARPGPARPDTRQRARIPFSPVAPRPRRDAGRPDWGRRGGGAASMRRRPARPGTHTRAAGPAPPAGAEHLTRHQARPGPARRDAITRPGPGHNGTRPGPARPGTERARIPFSPPPRPRREARPAANRLDRGRRAAVGVQRRRRRGRSAHAPDWHTPRAPAPATTRA